MPWKLVRIPEAATSPVCRFRIDTPRKHIATIQGEQHGYTLSCNLQSKHAVKIMPKFLMQPHHMNSDFSRRCLTRTWRREAFTRGLVLQVSGEKGHQRNFDTEKLLQREAFSQESFYREKHWRTEAFTHRETFTKKNFYTEKLLHWKAFTRGNSHMQQAFSQRNFNTEKLLHRKKNTQRSFTRNGSRNCISKTGSRRQGEKRTVLEQFEKGNVPKKIISAEIAKFHKWASWCTLFSALCFLLWKPPI